MHSRTSGCHSAGGGKVGGSGGGQRRVEIGNDGMGVGWIVLVMGCLGSSSSCQILISFPDSIL